MSVQALPNMYKKCWLYLTSLRHLLDLDLYFDLKFKSLMESCGIEILSHQQILIQFYMFKMVLGHYKHKQKFAFSKFYIIKS